MNFDTYLASLKTRLQAYFSFQDVHDPQFDLVAVFNFKETQTVLTKNNVMDFYESKELIMLSCLKDFATLEDSLNESKTLLLEATNPSRNHKATYLTRVFVTETLPDKSTIKLIKHFHFTKIFHFFIWGWAEVKVVLVSLQDGKIYTNPAGRQGKKTYQISSK